MFGISSWNRFCRADLLRCLTSVDDLLSPSVGDDEGFESGIDVGVHASLAGDAGLPALLGAGDTIPLLGDIDARVSRERSIGEFDA
jgi:hypothetical protein